MVNQFASLSVYLVYPFPFHAYAYSVRCLRGCFLVCGAPAPSRVLCWLLLPAPPVAHVAVFARARTVTVLDLLRRRHGGRLPAWPWPAEGPSAKKRRGARAASPVYKIGNTYDSCLHLIPLSLIPFISCFDLGLLIRYCVYFG